MSAYNLFVSEPKFTKLFCPIGDGMYRSLRRSVTVIFAMKVESCQKSRKILDVFCRCHTCPSASHMEKFREVIPTSP